MFLSIVAYLILYVTAKPLFQRKSFLTSFSGVVASGTFRPEYRPSFSG